MTGCSLGLGFHMCLKVCFPVSPNPFKECILRYFRRIWIDFDKIRGEKWKKLYKLELYKLVEAWRDVLNTEKKEKPQNLLS